MKNLGVHCKILGVRLSNGFDTILPISVDTKFWEVSTCLVGGRDEIPIWVLKEYVYILDTPIAALADVPLLPKVPTIYDFTKDQRLISLTPTVSKIAERFVIDSALNPVGC